MIKFHHTIKSMQTLVIQIFLPTHYQVFHSVRLTPFGIPQREMLSDNYPELLKNDRSNFKQIKTNFKPTWKLHDVSL